MFRPTNAKILIYLFSVLAGFGFLISPAFAYTLNVYKAGEGRGIITVPLGGGQGLDCGNNCAYTSKNFASSFSADLYVLPDSDSVFAGWSGCSSLLAANDPPICRISNASSDKTVTANFALKRKTVFSGPLAPRHLEFTLTKSGSAGAGSVMIISGGIPGICDSNCLSVFKSYYLPTALTLTAAPAAGSSFVSWKGCDFVDYSASPPGCYLTVNTNRSVTVNFSSASPIAAPAGTYTLNLTKTGKSNANINGVLTCGSDCNKTSATFYSPATLNVSLGNAPLLTTVSWAGVCAGTAGGLCSVTVDGVKTATVNGEPNFFSVDIVKTTNLPAIISGTPDYDQAASCGYGCTRDSFVYAAGTNVTLSEAHPADTAFNGWTGMACSGFGANSCDIASLGSSNVLFGNSVYAGAGFSAYAFCAVSVQNNNMPVTASFLRMYPLTVSSGPGGVVNSNPARIRCSGGTCVKSFPGGTDVTLTALPQNDGIRFDSWSGAGASYCVRASSQGPNICTLPMNQALSITANFTSVSYPLKVAKIGAGSGLITGTPIGFDSINCGGTCEISGAPINSIATLTAAPDSDSVFIGWSGCTFVDGSFTPPKCHVTVNTFKNITAQFDPVRYSLLAVKYGTGSGSLSAANLICAQSSCFGDYNIGSSVTLTATPDAGSVVSWTGTDAADCIGNTCVFSMTGPKYVIANFNLSSPAAPLSAFTLNLTKSGGGAVSGTGGFYCDSLCSSASQVYSASSPFLVTLGSDLSSVSWGGCASYGTDASGNQTCQVNFTCP